MAYTCNLCGSYVGGISCPTCEQTNLLKKSVAQQKEFFDSSEHQRIQNQKQTDFEERVRFAARAEEDLLAKHSALLDEMQAEIEQKIKESFSEIALLIQTNTDESISSVIEDFCKNTNKDWNPIALSESGGNFMPARAEIYRKYFTDYILNNPQKASVIAIAKSIFEKHCKSAKEISDAHNAINKKNETIKQEREQAENALTDAANAELAAAKKIREEKSKKVAHFFMMICVVLSYLNFKDSHFLYGFLFAIGAIVCWFTAWIIGADSHDSSDNSFSEGFIKGLKG
jgi:exonuclease VII large subunit